MQNSNYIEVLKKSADKILKNNYWRDKFSMVVLLASLTLNLGVWLFLGLKLKPSDYPVPIHYNVYFGIDVIDYWTSVFLIPAMGLGIIIINLLISYLIHEREKFISQFLLSGSCFIQLILFLAAIGAVIIR